MTDRRPLAIIDLDGVVADVRHRLHHLLSRPKDWDGFFGAATDDPPHPEGLAVVEQLVPDHEIVFLTGRPVRCRADTEAWLARHGLGGHELLMRPGRDRRPAATVKVEMLRRRAAGQEVAVVVDDDDQVVEAMRRDAALQQAQEDEGRT